MTATNANDLLQGTRLKEGFKDNITIKQNITTTLSERRDIIRNRIRDEANEWTTRVAKAVLFEGTPVMMRDAAPPKIAPKFRMQGSQVYGTANDPAWKPPQEIDLDDGLFVPVAFFERHDVTNPILAAKGLFKLVEAILDPLCNEYGWNCNKEKSNCIRIEFGDGTHYDVALYALADKSYQQLVEARLAKVVNTDEERQRIRDSLELRKSFYDEIASADIKLATRKDGYGWIDSDPRQLERWFNQQKKIFGEQVVRASRYVKAWRDYEWNSAKCDLSSLAIMECTVRAFHDLGSKIDQTRDDIALLEVTRRLAGYFNGPIPNPIQGLPDLNEGWDEQTRNEIVKSAERFNVHIKKALGESATKQQTIKQFQEAFGTRVPDDISLVKFASSASVIRSYEPATRPQPDVRRERSG